jgi:hypothetical protein
MKLSLENIKLSQKENYKNVFLMAKPTVYAENIKI